MIATCPECGRRFIRPRKVYARIMEKYGRVFCSKRCRNKFLKENPDVQREIHTLEGG